MWRNYSNFFLKVMGIDDYGHFSIFLHTLMNMVLQILFDAISKDFRCVWAFMKIFLWNSFIVGLPENMFVSAIFWILSVLHFEFCYNVVFLFYRPTNKAQKATQEKAFSEPRTMPDERCLFQKYEMAGCNKSWQETNPFGYCWFTRRGCTPVWQVTYTSFILTIYIPLPNYCSKYAE